jgi:hypothetical protein
MSRPVDAPPRRAAALLAAAVASAVALAVYAIVRSFERLVLPEPNPAALVWSERSPIFWRLVIAVYAGGAAAFGAIALAGRDPRAATRLLLVAVATAIALVVAQTVLLP